MKSNLLTSPFDLASYKEAISEALIKGTKREVESEEKSQKTFRSSR